MFGWSVTVSRQPRHALLIDDTYMSRQGLSTDLFIHPQALPSIGGSW